MLQNDLMLAVLITDQNITHKRADFYFTIYERNDEEL